MLPSAKPRNRTWADVAVLLTTGVLSARPLLRQRNAWAVTLGVAGTATGAAESITCSARLDSVRMLSGLAPLPSPPPRTFNSMADSVRQTKP